MIERIPERIRQEGDLQYADPLTPTEAKLNEVIQQINTLTVLYENLQRDVNALLTHVHETGREYCITSAPKKREFTPGLKHKQLRPLR